LSKYIVKLTEQEEMNLRQVMAQPGSEVIFKLLQNESLDAQSAAMECTDPDANKRLLVLTDAQVTAKVVSNLTRKLAAYREMIQADIEEVIADPLGFNMYEERTN